jgi:hypothetical protein
MVTETKQAVMDLHIEVEFSKTLRNNYLKLSRQRIDFIGNPDYHKTNAVIAALEYWKTTILINMLI